MGNANSSIGRTLDLLSRNVFGGNLGSFPNRSKFVCVCVESIHPGLSLPSFAERDDRGVMRILYDDDDPTTTGEIRTRSNT